MIYPQGQGIYNRCRKIGRREHLIDARLINFTEHIEQRDKDDRDKYERKGKLGKIGAPEAGNNFFIQNRCSHHSFLTYLTKESILILRFSITNCSTYSSAGFAMIFSGVSS